jgi:chaperone required for assembly of F1-ATPase
MTDNDGPMQAAQRLMRPELPKRFYKSADVRPEDGGFAVVLDGRPVRTPAKNPIIVPTEEFARALAEEWNAQKDVIDPADMPLARIVNSAVDGVAREADAVREEIVKYAGSDLLCYRAEGPERLVALQSGAWDPVLTWAREAFDASFVLAEGVVYAAQPQEALEAVRGRIEDVDIFRLAAASAVTTLTGSALLALALLGGRLSAEEAWAAAHVDEDWNIEQWGADEEAAIRRDLRYREMAAAARVIALLR